MAHIDMSMLITAEDKAAAAEIALVARMTAVIEAHLDARAAERQYDSIRTAVTYRDDPNPVFAAEGQALFEWRSAVWTYATAELARVQAGERTAPGVEEFVGELPAFAWPDPPS